MVVALHLGMLVSVFACALCAVFGHRRLTASDWLGQTLMVAAMLDMMLPGQWLPPLLWSAMLIAMGMYWGARGRLVRSVRSVSAVRDTGCDALTLHRALTFVAAGGLTLLLAAPAHGLSGATGASGLAGHAHGALAGGIAGWLCAGVAALLIHAAWLVARQLRRRHRHPAGALEAASLGVMLAAMAASVL